MRSSLFLLLACCISVLQAQSFESISLQTQTKSVWVELASLNRLQIQHSTESDLIRLRFNNHESYPEPVMIDKDDLIEIKVLHDAKTLPQAQQNKYRAGQPLYPNYILEVPLNCQLKISYKQGNTQAKNFTGDLELYLDHGTVNLVQLSGSGSIQSYGGVINCLLANAKVAIESKEGQVETDIKHKSLAVGKQFIRGHYGDPRNDLRVTTILGKVTLSRPEDK